MAKKVHFGFCRSSLACNLPGLVLYTSDKDNVSCKTCLRQLESSQGIEEYLRRKSFEKNIPPEYTAGG